MKYKLGDLVKVVICDYWSNDIYYIGLIVGEPLDIKDIVASGSAFYEIMFIGENESDFYFEDEILERIE